MQDLYSADELVYMVREREIRAAAVTRSPLRTPASPRSSCRGSRIRPRSTAGCARKTSPAAFRSPPASSRSSGRTRTPPACSPARATRRAPTGASRCSRPTSEAKRLSTAFDSVTLYGFDPDTRPDIYGKVGTSGVSICTLDDVKVLYGGFELCAPNTSVSMTINGPAPIMLAMFLNAAIDQQVDAFTAQNDRRPDGAECGRTSAPRSCPTSAAPSRPISSRRTRARTPAFSPSTSP